MDLFTLVAKLTMDSSEYERGIAQSKQSFMGLANTVSAKAVAVGTMVAHGVEKAASSLLKFGTNAVQASADIEAEIALYQQVFGELESAATGALESISQDTNILSTRLRGIGTSAFMQFKGAGVDAGNAIAAMDKYTRLAADAAAAYNISIEEADVKLRSFIRGNTEAGDSIGLFTSESQRNERALATYGQKWQALTEAQKQMLMLGVVDEIYTQTEVIGQAAREGHEWENVIGNLKIAFRDFSATVGGPFREVLIPVIENLKDFLIDETVTLRIGMIASSIGNLAGKAFDGAIDFIDGLIRWSNGEEPGEGYQIIADIFSIVGNIGSAVYNGAKAVIDAMIGLGDSDTGPMKQASTFFSDFKTLTESEGFQTAAEVIGGVFATVLAGWLLVHHPLRLLAAAIALLATHWEDVKNFCKDAWQAITDFCNTVFVDPISGMLDTIGSKFESVIEWANNAAGAIASFFGVTRSDYTPTESVDEYFAPGTGGGQYDTGWGSDYKVGGGGRGFATGLDYVPYNNFRARLHEGEAVLTKAEASQWRSGGSVQAIDYAALGSAVGAAVREALEGVGLYTDDGTRIADLTTQRVSRNIASNARYRRYQPV